jgi:hypothetical protein
MRRYQFALAAALLGLATAAWAGGPAGAGNLGLGLAYMPTATLSGQTMEGMDYILQGDFPVWSGLQGQVGLGADSVHQQSVNNPFPGLYFNDTTDSQNYSLNLQLNLHPAAFAGLSFNPGNGANPDGWVYWPSVNVGYTLNKGDQAQSSIAHGLGGFSNWGEFFRLDQTLNYQLTLPLAEWLSVSAGYNRNLASNFTESNNGFTNNVYGWNEGESLGVSTYINLVPGAGADKARPFLPHFGRLGQLDLAFAWTRSIQAPYTDPANDYIVTVGAPVSDCLSLAISGGNTVINQGSFQVYDAFLSWAFGSPEERTGN